jgi:hypothetical protein
MSAKKSRTIPIPISGEAILSQQRAIIAQALAELFLLMASVETNSVEAKLNETSMDDNNGGRIWF